MEIKKINHDNRHNRKRLLFQKKFTNLAFLPHISISVLEVETNTAMNYLTFK